MPPNDPNALILSALVGILEKSRIAGAFIVVCDENGAVSNWKHIRPDLRSDIRKFLYAAGLQASVAQLLQSEALELHSMIQKQFAGPVPPPQKPKH